jgi:hypothetical protein
MLVVAVSVVRLSSMNAWRRCRLVVCGVGAQPDWWAFPGAIRQLTNLLGSNTGLQIKSFLNELRLPDQRTAGVGSQGDVSTRDVKRGAEKNRVVAEWGQGSGTQVAPLVKYIMKFFFVSHKNIILIHYWIGFNVCLQVSAPTVYVCSWD